jgi:serine/threonine-protein kinase
MTDPPNSSSTPAEQSPCSQAGYEILAEVGRGSKCIVLKARHPGLTRIVALRLLLAGPQATPVQVHRFRIEAECLANLQHPNIVEIYEVGESQGRPYFTLELL